MRMPDFFGNGRRNGFLLITGLALAQAGAAAAAALATRSLFGDLHAAEDIAPAAIAVLVLSGLIIGAARIGFAVTGERIGQSYALDIRERLLRHATGLTGSDIAARRQGYIALRFVGDLNAFRIWISKGAPQMISAPIQIVAMIAVLFMMSPIFGVIAAMLFGAAALLIWARRRALAAAHGILRSRRAAIAADMTDLMPVAPQLAQMGRAGKEMRRLRGRTADMVDAAIRQTMNAESLAALADASAAIAGALILLMAHRTGVAPGSVAGALAALSIGAVALRELALSADHFGAFSVAREKCEAALDRKRARPRSGRASLPEGPLSLSIKRLETPFGAPVSLTLGAGESARLDAGCLASADFLFSALLGRERCAEQSIKIGGVDLTAIQPEILRQRVAEITTSPVILKGSIRKSLTLGARRRPSDKALKTLLSDIGASDRLRALDESVLAGAADLSPIDRLHISLARASVNGAGLLLVERTAADIIEDLGMHSTIRNLHLAEATALTL